MSVEWVDRRGRQARKVALGDRGELWALNKLRSLGFHAELTPRNTRDVDIVVRDDLDRVCNLQVKSRDRYKNWTMSRRHENVIDQLLFYCFLEFSFEDESREPLCWVVPSGVVANVLRETHQAYLAQSPDTRRDTTKRNFRGDYTNRGLVEKYGPRWLDGYVNAWDSLQFAR
jgi:hypothetical protein